jgi:SpoVK/Ycf46/Vps4 family AAA+-type ATPase
VCAGDLGTNVELLERNLVEITSLAHKWKAIVLLDEADVYLAQRSLQDVQRNGLVSVFLRHLEYFQGIMFLTTNRVTTFDEAFQSRIHFAMKFSDLSITAKKKIWKTFLEKVPPTKKEVTDNDVADLSHKNINGRQVRLYQLGRDRKWSNTDRFHHLDQELCTYSVGSGLMERGESVGDASGNRYQSE